VIPRVTLSAVTSEEMDLIGVAASRVGTTLHGKYQIDKVLGVGGMGIVYAATHRNGKRFAIKLLHPEFSSRRDIRTRFLREGYVANAVNHPGVVAVLDDDMTDDGSAFLVMELLDGSTVEALGARPGSRMPLREALGIAYQLLDVLDAAHTKTIVHRDIKPANLFVIRDGQVKVLDFGLARLRDATTGLNTTRTGETMGTPAFMPPEQARGDVSAIDPRTDIWAAGATIFTALSGRLVHDGDNARQVMVRAATMPAPSLASVIPEAPASVVQLLAKALEFDKAQRWSSAAAMRDAVGIAYEELFGEPSREHLKLLFDLNPGTTETAITELSPKSNSIPMLRDSAVVSASTAVSAGEQSEPTTLALAESPRERPGIQRSTLAVIIGAGLLTLVAGGASLSFLKREVHSNTAVINPSSSTIVPHSSLGRESTDPGLGLQTGDSPLSSSLPAISPESLPPITQPSSSLRVSRSAQRPVTKILSPAAPGNLSQTMPAAIPPSLASSVQLAATPANKAPPVNDNTHSEDSRKHRRIDDAVDHQ